MEEAEKFCQRDPKVRMEGSMGSEDWGGGLRSCPVMDWEPGFSTWKLGPFIWFSYPQNRAKNSTYHWNVLEGRRAKFLA